MKVKKPARNKDKDMNPLDFMDALQVDGWAVVLFTPEECRGVNTRKLEEAMIEAGNRYIFQHEGEDNDL